MDVHESIKEPYRKRLLRLREILIALPAEKFSIDGWVSECGTVACAGGWAAMDPELKAEGLELRQGNQFMVPMFAGTGGFRALQLFFGMPEDVSFWVFSEDGYLTKAIPASVVDHLDLYLKYGPHMELYLERRGIMRLYFNEQALLADQLLPEELRYANQKGTQLSDQEPGGSG